MYVLHILKTLKKKTLTILIWFTYSKGEKSCCVVSFFTATTSTIIILYCSNNSNVNMIFRNINKMVMFDKLT